MFAIDCTSELELLIVDENDRQKYRLRAETREKRVEWVAAINQFTKNLDKFLKIVERPTMRTGTKLLSLNELPVFGQKSEEYVPQTQDELI